MNIILQSYARTFLKDNLHRCSEEKQLVFKRMYANGMLELPIDKVINQMPYSKLDWAMVQLENTLKKNSKKNLDTSN